MQGRPKFLILLLRVSMGWVFFYSGVIKVLDKKWSAKGFLESAQTFPDFYQWFASPANLYWVDFLNKWGQVAIGGALILGIFVGFAAIAGVALMALYYLPGLDFPFVGSHALLVDEHIVYILALLLLVRLRAGKVFGISQLFGRSLY
ncbi:MAG: DoxX family membrane protein [Candidatus Doudnabacteria bacterium]|nr:DoxX family membrane protein [Candidatus Doudnabacteria bacterium]